MFHFELVNEGWIIAILCVKISDAEVKCVPVKETELPSFDKNILYLPDIGVSTIDICMQAFRDIYKPNWTGKLAQLLTIYVLYWF